MSSASNSLESGADRRSGRVEERGGKGRGKGIDNYSRIKI